MSLMSRAFDFLFERRRDAEALHGLSPRALVSLLSPTPVSSTNPATTALLRFDGAVAAAIREAKYHGSTAALRMLAEALAAYLATVRKDATGEIILVPVPLSSARRRERGFNQCEEIARAALALGDFGMTVDATVLIRTHDTKAQALEAGIDRGKDLSYAFCARAPIDQHRSYLVFDDVITTGATMSGALSALRDAGASTLVPLCLAR